MAEATQGSAHHTVSEDKHVHHGRTMAAWVGTTIATVAFIIGGIAVMMQNWPLFWIGGVALLVVGMVAGKILQSTGHGAV